MRWRLAFISPLTPRLLQTAHCAIHGVMGWKEEDDGISRYRQPLEWNAREELKTELFYQPFTSGQKGAKVYVEDVFDVGGECEHWWEWGAMMVGIQDRQIAALRRQICVLQREVLRVWHEEDLTLRWWNMSSGRRFVLLLMSVIDVEDMADINLKGRRQLCPELVIKQLASDPIVFSWLLHRFTLQTNDQMVIRSHPLVDAFLGLPHTVPWGYANLSKSQYIQSVIVSRVYYITTFLAAVILRLVGRPIGAPLKSTLPTQYINPRCMLTPPPSDFDCTPPPVSVPLSQDLEFVAHQYSLCTGCMGTLGHRIIWCKTCPYVQYCSVECQAVDLEEHNQTCGKKRTRRA